MALDILVLLYSFNAFILAASYMPQIIKYYRTKTGARATCLKSLAMWSYSSSVSLCYALFENGDETYVLVATFDWLGCIGMFGAAYYNRLRYGAPPSDAVLETV